MHPTEWHSPALPGPELIQQLNQQDPEHIRLLAVYPDTPDLLLQGEASLDLSQEAYQQALAQLQHNESVCLLTLESLHSPLAAYTSDYASVMALRAQGQRPPLVAATCVAVDASCTQLYLQRRSQRNHLYPSYLSLFGGGISPLQDRAQPAQAMLRELQEESGLYGHLGPSTPWLLTQEVNYGAVQLNALQVRCLNQPPHSGFDDEGSLVTLPLSQLAQALQQDNYQWTPLARLVLQYFLAWRVES